MFDKSTRSLYCFNVLRVRKIYFKITLCMERNRLRKLKSQGTVLVPGMENSTVPPRSQLCAATGPQLSEVTQARMSNHIPQVFGAESSLTRPMLRNSTTRILLENEGMFGNIYLALQFKIKLIFLLPHPTYFVLPFCPP